MDDSRMPTRSYRPSLRAPCSLSRPPRNNATVQQEDYAMIHNSTHRTRGKDLLWLTGAVLCLHATPLVMFMPVSCHSWCSKVLPVRNLAHVTSALASVEILYLNLRTSVFDALAVTVRAGHGSGPSTVGSGRVGTGQVQCHSKSMLIFGRVGSL